jgi:Tol biopolymer transport system component
VGTTSEDRLDSWKEIAGYLKRDVTTVQRWEKREAMPVHRHLHDKLGSVYALRSELDAWARSRNLPPAYEDAAVPAARPDGAAAEAGPASRRRSRRSFVWSAAAGALILAAATAWWALERREFFWRNPLEGARVQTVTDFGGSEQAAAVSRDGRFIAFLSDRDGRTDVWITQVGTGQFYNLTRGSVPELINPLVRTLGFSPDGAWVAFWTRGKTEHSTDPDIGIWALPTLGGQPRPYLEGAAEFDWSRDGTRLVYHTTKPGDPTFVRDADPQAPPKQIFAAPAGLHAHFPVWSPDGAFVYFVQGYLPETMDIWRMRPTGEGVERVTHHSSLVSHPVFLDQRTIAYLAADWDGSGPWLYSLDAHRRMSHRLEAGLDRYTSLAASADGRRLAATRARPHGSLWRLPLAETPVDAAAAVPIPLTTGRGFAPRFGAGGLLYVSSKGTGDGIWKLADGAASELWSAPEARIVGGPEVAPDGRVAFAVARPGRTLLYVMNPDGTDARVVTGSLELRGAPAWAPDGRSLTTAVNVDGMPNLFRISLDGASAPLVREYSVDPVWSPGGEFLVYSGADVGTTFPVKAVAADGAPHAIPDLTLSRGGRRLRFLPGRWALLALRGGIQHKDLWLIDLETGAERQLTNLPPGFSVRDFDVSPDGREVVLERVEDHSDVVLIDLARRD